MKSNARSVPDINAASKWIRQFLSLYHYKVDQSSVLLTMLARLLLLALRQKQHNSTRRLEFQTHPKPFKSVGLMLCHRCFPSSSACKRCSKQFMLMQIYKLPENSSWPQSNAFSGSPGWLFCATLSVWEKKKKKILLPSNRDLICFHNRSFKLDENIPRMLQCSLHQKAPPPPPLLNDEGELRWEEMDDF